MSNYLKEFIKIYNGRDYKLERIGEIPVYGTGGIIFNTNNFLHDGEALLLPRKGSLENISFVDGKFWTIDTMYYALSINEKLNLKYLYYYLNLLDLSPLDSGSTLPSMTFDAYYNLKIEIPEKNIQDSVEKFLSYIDKKIDINNKINENLEKQTKLIYDYWFIQFDFPDENGSPYRSSGGKMVWNEELKREIPVGWKVSLLSVFLNENTAIFDYSQTLPVIDLSVMPSNSISLNELNSSNNFTTNLYKMDQGDILFGSIRPYLKKAGIAPCNGVFAGTIHSYKVNDDNFYNFILVTMTRPIFFDFALNVSTGSKMPVASSESLLSYKVAYSEDLVKKFNQISLKEIIPNNIKENQKLIELRDWLLPMLMNSQATITDTILEKKDSI